MLRFGDYCTTFSFRNFALGLPNYGMKAFFMLYNQKKQVVYGVNTFVNKNIVIEMSFYLFFGNTNAFPLN
jgi:hypothetical protein